VLRSECFFLFHVISAGRRDIETWCSPPILSIFRSLPGRTVILVFFLGHFGSDEVLECELCDVVKYVEEVQCYAIDFVFAKGKLYF
jgi:hypothetical protein